ncbi:MXAN_6640 family putative metalloprotease [Nocardioides sp. WS12]|uniref:MXAN_6640 family putative metalloprotease n=1 Tax=Nocardioides sp. WS12 TaxID=2486272 RepID=UPI0015F7DE57|nr:MXAN_6640 family putative metalloprotease [Nocardioides sp. WS12]
MTRRSNLPFSGLLIALLALLLLVPSLGTAAQADPTDPAAPAGPGAPAAETPREVAEQALEAAEELLDPTAAPATTKADREHGKDVTLALRDLAASRADLPKDKKDDAGRLLARPTDGLGASGSYECDGNNGPPCYQTPENTPLCSGYLCVHYVDGADASAADPENNGTSGRWSGTDAAYPDYVEFVWQAFSVVANAYTNAGYQRPASDGFIGGNGADKVDIYIAELGQFGIYGYCATDENISGQGPAPAYCVVDNNYSSADYPNHTPADNLKVTAAHEYFHAVQFAYDANEDGWFMEGTATWAEDELFNSINDNRSYLPYGPLGVPSQPLDRWGNLAQYGSWIFFRYLGERYPTAEGLMPVIIRRMWEKAGAGGQYSVQAITSTLTDLRTTMNVQFAGFAFWNRNPAQYYSEGAGYRPAPLYGTYNLSGSAPSKSLRIQLHHLSAKHYRFVPKMTGAWRLRVQLNLNYLIAGGAAVVTVKKKGQAPVAKIVALNSAGDGVSLHTFGGAVDWVEVAAVSASTRYVSCGTRNFEWTCGGVPKDDSVYQSIIVKAVR